MSKNMGIYKILNLENGKFYLGSSNNLKKRKREHFWALKEGKHDNPYLQNAFNKYGEEKFVFEVIEYVYKEENLRLIEQNYLDKYDACNRDIGYNINKYASGGGLIGEDNPNYGKPMSEEQKQKIRETMIGRKYSLERRRNMSKGRKGKCIGKNHPMYGKPVSEARRKHQSKIMKGRYAGENNPFYGQKHSEETRNKISLANMGRVCNDFTKQRIKESHSKIILDLQTGVFYNSANELADLIKMKRTTLTSKLSGQNKNNTQYIYI